MKKTILTIALSFALGLTTIFANDDKGISQDITTSFNKEFSHAKQLMWKKEKNYTIATFTLSGQVISAYYNADAELVAIVHNILSDHLPIYLLTDLKKNYSDYWVTSLFEGVTDGQSSYYITVENADQAITMKSVNSTDWIAEKKTKKVPD